MAKRSRKKTSERKDFQKIKFKVGKQKPKGLNVTDTTFKSRAINIVEQFQCQTENETSSRGRDIKQICSLLSHHTTTKRVFAIAELSDYVLQYPSSIRTYLSDILNAVLPRLMDDEPRIHTRMRTVLQSIFDALGEPSLNLLEPFATLIISYVICGLTHINNGVACNALTVVDILPNYLDLRAAREDSGKLLNALISMIVTVQNQRHQNVQLNSVGFFATANSRVLVCIRILHVLEGICASEEKEKTAEIISWDIRKPTHFFFRHPLVIDLAPRAVALSFTVENSGQNGAEREENIILIMRRLINLVRIYWPTVAERVEDDECDKKSSFNDLAGRRCCIDIVLAIVRKLINLHRCEELIMESEMGNDLMKVIRLLIEDYAVHNKGPVTKYPKDDFKCLKGFVERVISSYPLIRNVRIPFLFHQSLYDLLKDYSEFVSLTGTEELAQKIHQELNAAEKRRDTWAHRLSAAETHLNKAASQVAADHNGITQMHAPAELLVVDHDHCYHLMNDQKTVAVDVIEENPENVIS
ncbi:uncharacterized protein LOC129594333 [Paramacrobiotus metropolitanus]|uniref:uncharacterized protein LOC129594333 n=1 Tax=Paramacrobiotus metropolitanus TaxID=2943436 RepID=UPI0024464402|nr:uncharacterized protein LOC129594333 [Paramacrobiotus metropolitanus]